MLNLVPREMLAGVTAALSSVDVCRLGMAFSGGRQAQLDEEAERVRDLRETMGVAVRAAERTMNALVFGGEPEAPFAWGTESEDPEEVFTPDSGLWPWGVSIVTDSFRHADMDIFEAAAADTPRFYQFDRWARADLDLRGGATLGVRVRASCTSAWFEDPDYLEGSRHTREPLVTVYVLYDGRCVFGAALTINCDGECTHSMHWPAFFVDQDPMLAVAGKAAHREALDMRWPDMGKVMPLFFQARDAYRDAPPDLDEDPEHFA